MEGSSVFLLVCHLVKRDGLWLGKSQELEEQLKGNSVETLPRSRFGNMGRQHVSRLDQILMLNPYLTIIHLPLRGTAGGPSKVGSKVWDGCSGPLGVGLHAGIPVGPAPAPGTSYVITQLSIKLSSFSHNFTIQNSTKKHIL